MMGTASIDLYPRSMYRFITDGQVVAVQLAHVDEIIVHRLVRFRIGGIGDPEGLPGLLQLHAGAGPCRPA